MGKNACKKTVEIAPLAGPMNTRAMPKDVPFGVWRWRQNLWVDPSNNTCKRPGFTRLQPGAEYNNQDLHDQGDPTRQPLTYLWEAISTAGSRRIIAGTDRRLYASDLSGGTWNPFYMRAEAPPAPVFWQAAQGNDVVLFSNSLDPLFLWSMDAPAVTEIESLTAIGLTSARVLYSWKGVIFLGDVTMDGERIPHRVVWSDINLADFNPTNASIAGFQDLSYGERVLQFLELGDYLLIYTDRSIWQVTAIGSTAVWNFRAAYSDLKTADACLVYPGTLASTGSTHVFLGSDGLYQFDLFKPKPERTAWMDASSNIILDTMDADLCQQHVAAYFPPTSEYILSWIEKGKASAERSIVYNMRAQTSDVLDHGFSAMLSHIPDLRPSVAEEVEELCLCSQAEFDAIMAAQYQALHPGKEPPPDPVGICGATAWDCQATFESAYTTKTIKVPGWEDGPDVEDPYSEVEDGALCRHLKENFPASVCTECNTRAVLVLASARDLCLKEVNPNNLVCSREMFTAADSEGCASYTHEPIKTYAILGPMNLDLPDEMKTITRLEFEYYAQLCGTDLRLVPEIGTSDYAAEVLPVGFSGDNCGMRFSPLTKRKLVCIQKRQTHNWTFWHQGRYLAVKFTIEGFKDGDVGGPVCLPVLRMEVYSNTRWPTAKE